MRNLIEKSKGAIYKSFLEILCELAWQEFRLHDFCEAHLLYREVPERAIFEMNEKEYKFVTYACSVDDVNHILPAFKLMFNIFYSGVTKDKLVIVRQKPRVSRDSVENRVLYLSFRTAIIDQEIS